MTSTEQTDKVFMFMYHRQEPIMHRSLQQILGDSENDAIRSLEAITRAEFAGKFKNLQATLNNNTEIFNYSLNTQGIEFVERLPKEYKEKPYSYYLYIEKDKKTKEERKEELTLKKLDIDYNLVQKQLEDYPIVQARALKAEKIAIRSAIIAGLVLIIQLIRLIFDLFS